MSSTREMLDHTSTLRDDLYRRRPPLGEAILIIVQPVSVPIRTPITGVYSIVTVGIMHRSGWRFIKDDGRASE